MSAEKRARKASSKSKAGKSEKEASKASGTNEPGPEDDGDELSPQARREWVAVAAYYRAECRGFEPGCEHDDWFEAEREIEKRLR